LFPTLSPTPGGTRQVGASRVADTSALPEGASVVNAQLAGLAALALAFLLAVTRLSIRRPAKQSAGQPGAESPSDTEAGSRPDAQRRPDADSRPGTEDKPGAPGA
jgi:hypothetical protein